ncbi:MAG: L-aspartate oxidase [Bacteroidetes bacterium]|nr:L-aspartate oxidase [Bacteroidota bacterium]MBU1797076.1 L-aspartate oxidase [Bacteroidota bacterium]
MQNYSYDFLVLGSGLAGLSTALYAAKFGTVALITKSTLDVSNSYFAQGGIAVVVSEEDSIESHYKDTMNAGVGLCNKEAVKILVSDGSKRIKELIEMGMEFDKVDGKLALGLEGAHSNNRVLHADGDATGRKVVEFFHSKIVNNSNITIFEKTFVFKLLVTENVCRGFLAYNLITKNTLKFTSNFTMLAAGGASAIYNRTTNPKSSTGDGIFLAYNAGAEIANMEFIQFHPSSLVTETDSTYLISEAVRGEGAYLVNSANERFLLGKHEKVELAPRDFVAYEIFKQLKIPNNKVFLTLKHLNSEMIRERFGNINKELNKYGLDIATDLIPVSPAAHYMIGGVKSGINGETSVSNLYVAGEVASTGVHGANRLASNSLLECLVFSKRAVDNSLNNKATIVDNEDTEINFSVDESKENDYLEKKNWIQQSMMNYVGIIRNESDLLKFENSLNKLEVEYNFEEYEYYSFQLKSIIALAKMMIKSALFRKESRGAQKRVDFHEQNDNYLFEIILQKNKLIKTKNIN